MVIRGMVYYCYTNIKDHQQCQSQGAWQHMATATSATCNPGALLSWCHVGEGRGLHPRTSGQDQAINAKNVPGRYGKLLLSDDNCMHMFYVFE